MPHIERNVPVERPECRSEETFNGKIRSSSREFPRNLNRNEGAKNAHYNTQKYLLEVIREVCYIREVEKGKVVLL